MRPSIRNYFERKQKSVGDENENNNALASQNETETKRKNYLWGLRRIRKYREKYQRKTPQQIKKMRQRAREVYHQRKLEGVSVQGSFITVQEWCRTIEELKKKRLARLAALERERRYHRRHEQRIVKSTRDSIPKRRLPRALMDPEELEAARQKARETQRRKRARQTDEQKEDERRKGRERMRQKRAAMSEEQRQALREIGKERMRLKRASLDPEQREELRKKERERNRNKWGSLDPEEKEAKLQRRREKSREKWALLTPEQREMKRRKDRHYNRTRRSRPPKKLPVPKKCKQPVDITSEIRKSNAELLIAEEAQPLLQIRKKHEIVPSMSNASSTSNDPLIQERTPLAINSEQGSTEQGETSINNMVTEDRQVSENRHEHSLQDDTLMFNQTSMPFVQPTEVRWQWKVGHCQFTRLQTAGQC